MKLKCRYIFLIIENSINKVIGKMVKARSQKEEKKKMKNRIIIFEHYQTLVGNELKFGT